MPSTHRSEMPKTLPADVLFAQKASAVSKCAGMDPREMDLEKFRTIAAIIFVRAYNAIYKENLTCTNQHTNEEDYVSGAQTVIDNLLEKTNVSALQSITGQDVAEGSHRAIGVLVGVLFAEGQRMWLEKQEIKKRFKEEINATGNSSDLAVGEEAGAEGNGLGLMSPPRSKKRAVRKKKKSITQTIMKQDLGYNDDKFEDDADADLLNFDDGADIPGASSPKEVRHLIDRIVYLEQELKRAGLSSYNNAPLTAARGKIRRMRNKEIALAGLQQQEKDADDDSSHPKAALRPSSAPSVGRRNAPARRLYSAEPVHGPETVAADPHPQPSAEASRPHSPDLPKYPASWYTYDLASGRRILMSDAEREAIAARRKKETLGTVLSISEMPVPTAPGSPKPKFPPAEPVSAPTAPHWPGPKTEQSADAWLKRQKEAREPTGKLGLAFSEKSAAMQTAIAAFKTPQSLAAYSLMHPLDLVVSVEHCHSCEAHNVTLRHKPGEYVKRADSLLRSLSQIAHECNLAARVGVARFHTHLIASKKLSDADNRIGAFEIQVAYRTAKGDVRYELLHSKLSTTQWPSRRGLELKLRAFLARADVAVPTFYKRPGADDSYSDTGTDGLGPYPIGTVSFAQTPVADPYWSFNTAASAASESSAISSPMHSHKTGFSDGYTGLQNVQWVFDSRNVQAPPLFEIGTTVYVLNAPNSSNKSAPPERHPLLAVVKTQPNEPSGSMKVKLKYHPKEDSVVETNLLSLSDHVPDDDLADRDDVPLSLCSLLLLGGLLQTGKPLDTGLLPNIGGKSPIVFRVDEQGVDFKDGNGAVHLGRASLFHQLRSLTISVEMKCADDDSLIMHPALGQPADAQLAYSENCLNWIQSQFGQIVNTLDLQRRMIERAQATKTTPPVLASVVEEVVVPTIEIPITVVPPTSPVKPAQLVEAGTIGDAAGKNAAEADTPHIDVSTAASLAAEKDAPDMQFDAEAAPRDLPLSDDLQLRIEPNHAISNDGDDDASPDVSDRALSKGSIETPREGEYDEGDFENDDE